MEYTNELFLLASLIATIINSLISIIIYLDLNGTIYRFLTKKCHQKCNSTFKRDFKENILCNKNM